MNEEIRVWQYNLFFKGVSYTRFFGLSFFEFSFCFSDGLNKVLTFGFSGTRTMHLF